MEKVKRYRCVKEFEVENYDDLQWIEIPVAYLAEYFKQIENN